MNRTTLRALILIFGLITAVVHLVILNLEMGRLSLLFTLNGLGYLALLAAFFLNLPFISRRRALLHGLFIAFAAITILAWIPNGFRNPLGYGTKLDEVLLIVALAMSWARKD